ncbi:2,3-butanediol dehydrogenase [Poseidonocella sp. HB161398]|uniref:2,3-butanediol dehydrogenase n=1 Tax=Poseidonocella sp. HB161398 TaxID=2320855 RepID=UPI00110858EE|nr:2,3-butanediol dehydrogenase [Poseidonocella sp. HB161398]
MKALRFHAAKDLRVEQIDDIPAPGPGQVAVKNRFVGICGTDLHEYGYGPIFIPKEPHPYTGAHGPQILGHEFGGTVTAIGEGVTNVKVGDRVAIQPLIGPRTGEYFGERGWLNLSPVLGLVGLSWGWGGMAEASVLNDYNVYPIPDTMSDEEAALVEPTAVTVYACDRAGVTAGSSVLVTGAGPIGILALLTAKAFGATKLFVSDLNETRLKLAREILPELVTINPAKDDLVKIVQDGTADNLGCDIAIECVGNDRALQSCLDAVRKQGTIVATGVHPGVGQLNFFDVTFKDVTVKGSWCYPAHSWPRVIDLISSGAIPAQKVVTKKIQLDDAVAEGFDALLDPAGSQLKILIEVG